MFFGFKFVSVILDRRICTCGRSDGFETKKFYIDWKLHVIHFNNFTLLIFFVVNHRVPACTCYAPPWPWYPQRNRLLRQSWEPRRPRGWSSSCTGATSSWFALVARSATWGTPSPLRLAPSIRLRAPAAGFARGPWCSDRTPKRVSSDCASLCRWSRAKT